MNPSFHLLGESLSILNALLWAVAVILFKISGIDIPPTGLNLFKNVIGLTCLFLTIALIGTPLPDISVRHWIFLCVSGAVGLGLGDTLFFQSLNILGASRSAIVDCLYSPFIILFAFLLLGEKLLPLQSVGAAMIMGGVLCTSMDGYRKELTPGQFWKGVLLGALSMGSMAFSIVAVKPILAECHVLWATAIRLIGGIAVLLVFTALHPERNRILSVFRPQPVWKFALPGGFIGSYPCLLLWIAGFKYAPANIAGLLTQTSSFFIVILAAVFLKEPMTRWKLAALFLASTGSVLVLI